MGVSQDSSKNGSQILSGDMIENIAKCDENECKQNWNIPEDYSEELRRRNCNLLNEWAPTIRNIKLIYLGESPPDSGRYIYDINSKISSKSGSLLSRIFVEMNDTRRLKELGERDQKIDPKWKKDLLIDLRKQGIAIIDCCHCSINKHKREN